LNECEQFVQHALVSWCCTRSSSPHFGQRQRDAGFFVGAPFEEKIHDEKSRHWHPQSGQVMTLTRKV
jgi:hypothetical protein